MVGKIEGRKRRDRQDEMVGWHHLLNGHEFEQALGLVMDREAWRAAVHGITKSWIQLNDFHFTSLHFTSRFIIAFLPWRKCLLISRLQSQSTVTLEPKKIKSLTVSIVSPSMCHEVMGLDAMILVF